MNVTPFRKNLASSWKDFLKSRTICTNRCKLGSHEIENGAKHLLEIKRLIAEKNKAEQQIKLREPDLLIVLTGGELAYTREDGVKIIPIGCLRD